MPEASRFWDLVLDFSDVSIHPRIPGKYGIQLWLIGAHFHWKLSSKKTLLHKPDSYGEQSSLRVNTSYTEDHESSAINAGLLLWPITGKRSNELWNWFVKTSIPGALSPVLENFCRSFSRPNWPPLGLRGWYLSRFFKTLPPNRPLFLKKISMYQSFILTRYVKELKNPFKIRTCVNKGIYNNYSYIILFNFKNNSINIYI